MAGSNNTTAIEFLRALYQPLKTGLIELRAIPVSRESRSKTQRIWTRRGSEIAEFAKRFGGKDSDYGVYFGVCRRKQEGGKKADVIAATALWADIDAIVNGINPEAIIEAIGKMPSNIQPSTVVHSGGGVHCFWYLDEPCGDLAAIEDANKVMMQMMGGDACFDVTRVLRLPDTYNNKRAVKKLCRVVYCASHLRYDLGDLMKGIIAWGKVLHHGKWVSPDAAEDVHHSDVNTAPHWFEDVVFRGGQRLPQRLKTLWEDRVRDHAPRGYIGVHEATIVTAARLYCSGFDADYVVRAVMDYQKSAPGVDTSGWDWEAEERKIRQSIETWGDKWRVLKKQKARKTNGEGRTVSTNDGAVSKSTKGSRSRPVSDQRGPISLRERRVGGSRAGGAGRR